MNTLVNMICIVSVKAAGGFNNSYYIIVIPLTEEENQRKQSDYDTGLKKIGEDCSWNSDWLTADCCVVIG